MNSDIEDLQMRLTFQEDVIQTLNDQIARQDAELKSVQAQLRELNKKLNDTVYQLETGGGASVANERPPHY